MKQTAGYVPGFFPGEHSGDYLELDIEIKTGRITNWVVPSDEVIQVWMDSLPEQDQDDDE